jgi:hypothetical protein
VLWKEFNEVQTRIILNAVGSYGNSVESETKSYKIKVLLAILSYQPNYLFSC